MVTWGNWGGGGRRGNQPYLLLLISCQQDLKLILDAAYSLWVELMKGDIWSLQRAKSRVSLLMESKWGYEGDSTGQQNCVLFYNMPPPKQGRGRMEKAGSRKHPPPVPDTMQEPGFIWRWKEGGNSRIVHQSVSKTNPLKRICMASSPLLKREGHPNSFTPQSSPTGLKTQKSF